jgi:hypothetical protein
VIVKSSAKTKALSMMDVSRTTTGDLRRGYMHPEDLGDLGLVAEIRCMTNSLVDQEMRWGVGFGRRPPRL